MTNEEARVLASARVILRTVACQYDYFDNRRSARIAAACERADSSIFDALNTLTAYGGDPAARRFVFATDQALIDSL